MGLDMYAYVGIPEQYRKFWEGAEIESSEPNKFEYKNNQVDKPRELAYWRKHHNLHGWMEQLWRARGDADDHPGQSFNGVELELTWQDLEALELAIRHRQLPATGGFFFGDPVDEFYLESDLEFCQRAKAELFLGLRVFYNSSW